MKISKFVAFFLTIALLIEPTVPLYAATPLTDNQNPDSQSQASVEPADSTAPPPADTPPNTNSGATDFLASTPVTTPSPESPESSTAENTDQPNFVSADTPATAGAEFDYSYSNSPELRNFLSRPNTTLTSGALGRSASISTIQIDGACAPENRSTADACTVAVSNILSQTERFTSISIPLFWSDSLPNPRPTFLSSNEGWFQNLSGGNGRMTIGGSDIYTIRYGFDPSDSRPKLSHVSFEDQSGQTVLTLRITAPIPATSPAPSTSPSPSTQTSTASPSPTSSFSSTPSPAAPTLASEPSPEPDRKSVV